jgi:hypothetical protein
MKDNKISVKEYIEDKGLLKGTYVSFNDKITIMSHVISELVNSIGGLNTSMLRRLATEVIIESISNIDMAITDENGLSGYDQLCYMNELDELKIRLGNEYDEMERILDERIDDYIRTETNPAITINAIYSHVTGTLSDIIELIRKQIQNINVEELMQNISQLIPKTGGVENEGE